MKKISELKIKKIIHRPTQSFDEAGKRIYNVFEYDLPYKAEFLGNEKQRILAKIIDAIPFFLVFYFPFHQPGIENKETNFTMHMNNKLCKTYIIKESQLSEIKKLLAEKK